MIKNLRAFFLKNVLPAIVPVRTPPPPPQPLTDIQIAEALSLFRKHMHSPRDLFRMLGGTKEIPPVQCPVHFSGWGYVEGRDEGAVVDHRLTIVEADEDMGFTEVCVLIDGLPCLLVQEGYYAHVGASGLAVTVIVERDYIDQILNPGLSWASTVDGFFKLPTPVQAVLRTIFDKLYDYHYNRLTSEPWSPKDAVEKVLEYGMRK